MLWSQSRELSSFDRLSQPSVDFYVFVMCTCLDIQQVVMYAMHKPQHNILFASRIILKLPVPPVREVW